MTEILFYFICQFRFSCICSITISHVPIFSKGGGDHHHLLYQFMQESEGLWTNVIFMKLELYSVDKYTPTFWKIYFQVTFLRKFTDWHESMPKKEGKKSVAELLSQFYWLPCSNHWENTSSQKTCYVGVLENIWDSQGTHSFCGIHWNVSKSDKWQFHSHLSKFKWKTEQFILKQIKAKLSYCSLSLWDCHLKIGQDNISPLF